MSLRERLKNIPRPRDVARELGRRSAARVVDLGRRTAERLDTALPETLRAAIPEMEIKIRDTRYAVHGLKVAKVEEPQAPEPSAEAEPAFFSTLPRGVRLQRTDPTSVDERFPHTTEDVRALIEYMIAALDNLHDVNDFDVVAAVDDDLYRLWRDVENKMKAHRQSEAKHQLKGMFNI